MAGTLSSVIRHGSGPVPASRGSRWYPRQHRIWSEQQPVDPTPLVIIPCVLEPNCNNSYPSLLPRCELQEDGKYSVLPNTVAVHIPSLKAEFVQETIGPVGSQHARPQCGQLCAHVWCSAPSHRVVATFAVSRSLVVARMSTYSPSAEHAMRVLGVRLPSLTSRGTVQQWVRRLLSRQAEGARFARANLFRYQGPAKLGSRSHEMPSLVVMCVCALCCLAVCLDRQRATVPSTLKQDRGAQRPSIRTSWDRQLSRWHGSRLRPSRAMRWSIRSPMKGGGHGNVTDYVPVRCRYSDQACGMCALH